MILPAIFANVKTRPSWTCGKLVVLALFYFEFVMLSCRQNFMKYPINVFEEQERTMATATAAG
jgi:hypothetical protein